MHSDEVTASKLFAAAPAELWIALLTALVAEVMKRAAEAVHGQLRQGAPTREALNEVAEKSGDSKLEPRADEWFRSNFDKIRESVKKHQEQRQRRLEQGQDSGSDKSPSAVPPELKTSSGKPICPTPGKTTTVLCTFGKGAPGNMDDIINSQLQYPKTTDFGPKDGGYNVLNVPDEYSKNPDQFWNEYNKLFLDDAISQGDNISLATTPTAKLLQRDNGQLTGFGRELQYLQSQGYSYDSSTGQMMKP